MSQDLKIQVGEVNTQWSFSFEDSVTQNPINLGSSTVNLVATAPSTPTQPGQRYTWPCSISADHTTAIYSTSGTDFTVPGTCSIQAVYDGPLGHHPGPVMKVKVLPNL